MQQMIKTKKPNKKIWLLLPFAGLFLELGFESFRFNNYVFLLATIPLFIFLYLCENKKSAFFGGYLAGIVFFGINLRWFFSVFPLSWIGIDDFLGALLIIFIWFFSVLAFALGIALFSLSFKVLKTDSWHDLFVGPSLWIIFEYIRPFFFESIWWSKDVLFGPHWTNGAMGFLLLNQPIAQLSKFTGIYGLSFAVVFMNLFAIYFFAGRVFIARERVNKDNALKIMAFFFLVFIIFSPAISKRIYPDNPNAKKVHISALQLNSNEGFHISDLKLLMENSGELKNYPELPHLIIFPEDSRFLFFQNNLTADEKEIQDNLLSNNKDSVIIANAFKGKMMTTIYKNSDGVIAKEQPKQLILPFGEYMPNILQIFLKNVDDGKLIEKFIDKRGTNKAPEKEKPYISSAMKIGTLTCSGILSSIAYRSLSNDGAEILINQSSYLIFHNSSFSKSQYMTMAKMQAISNNKYFVQSSRGGESFILDNNGDFTKIGPVAKDAFLDDTAYFISGKTLFVRFGNWLIAACGILVLLRTVEMIILKIRSLKLKKSLTEEQHATETKSVNY